MSKFIIHIGHGKTGSSFIQSVLALNLKKLKRYGFNYPRPDDLEEAKKGFITSGNGHKLIDKNGNLIRKNISFSLNNKSTIFSDETFVRRLILNNQFKNFLSKNNKKVKIILYTRNFFEHEFSAWGQLIKRHFSNQDLNSYLINNSPSGVYELLKDWIDLSKVLKFELIIRNYSNYKKDIFRVFFKDISGYDLPPENWNYPLDRVNRSLTFTEYELIRMINNFKFRDNLADKIVNYFPEVRTKKIFCSVEAYDIAKDKNFETINYINNFLEKNENILFEEKEDVTVSNKNHQDCFLSKIEMQLILDYLKENFLKEEKEFLSKQNYLIPKGQVINLRDIAIKIESSSELNLSDALVLMNIAKELRPEGKFIRKKIRDWRKLINEK